jgi:hypothetical protein
MATRKKAVHADKTGVGDVLQGAAKAIGSALGTFARKTGMVHADEQPKASGKIVKKAKKRAAQRKVTKKAKKRPSTPA